MQISVSINIFSAVEPNPNDVALIHLSDPVKFNDYIKPLPLPTPNQDFTGIFK